MTVAPTRTPLPTSTLPVPPTPIPGLGQTIINYRYDPLYGLKEANYSNGDYYHYTYDAVGNRKSQTTSIGGIVSTTTYNYDRANRFTDVNGVTYTYDNNGNLLNDGTNTYTYDSANHLVSFSNASSTATYRYNGLGDRLRETVNGVTTTFTMDLNTGLTQALSDGTNTYIYGVGRIAQVNTTTEYFLSDALGSVRQMTDATGAVTYARAYDPYGVVTFTNGASSTAYGFTSEYTSQGLVYLRARMYAPAVGRFLTPDTWGGDENVPMSYNLWNYTQSNPINYTDSTGHRRDGCNSDQERVATAEKYVSSTDVDGNIVKDAINTYTATGIAVQCYGGDNPFGDDYNSGYGIGQITNMQARTEYGIRIPNPKYPDDKKKHRGFGLRCYIPIGIINENGSCSICLTNDEMIEKYGQGYGVYFKREHWHDPRVPAWSVIYMRRRIEMVINACKGNKLDCDDKDRFIIAAMAQNGGGFTVANMDYIKTLYVRDRHITWGKYFENHAYKDTREQLGRFYDFAQMLNNDGYWLPPDILKNQTILDLKKGRYTEADEHE